MTLDKERDSARIKSLFRESAVNAPEPVRSESRLAWLEILYDEKDYRAVSILGETFLKDNPDTPGTAVLTAKSLFELNDLKSVLSLSEFVGYRDSPELFFLVLKAQISLDSPGWLDSLREFLVSIPVDPDSGKFDSALLALLKKQGFYSGIPALQRNLLMYRVYLERKNYSLAAVSAAAVISSGDSRWMSALLLDSSPRFFLRAGKAGAGLDSLETGIKRGKEDNIDPGILARLYWGAGYLAGKLGLRTKELEYYRSGMENAPDEISDKLLWYWFSAVMRGSPAAALDRIPELSDLWYDPEYFNDLIYTMATDLIRKNRWDGIRRMAEMLKDKADGDAMTRLSYLVARGIREGYLEGDDDLARSWFDLSMKTAEGLGSGLYYRIMSAAALGLDTREIPGGNIFRMENGKKIPADTDGESIYDELLYGSVRYGLPWYGKEVLNRYPGEFSLSGVRAFTGFLSLKGDYLDSIRILNRYIAEAGYAVRESDIRILYPAAFKAEIEKTAVENGLPVPVFTALLREESHFSADIVSAAGAVGLSQLMPSTAEDVASRMKIRNPDITDPLVNMSLGGWYLKNLVSRTDTVLKALFAYNGGLTRVRRWKSEYAGLPEDLFLEVIPYRETSLYGRKVLVSAVIYGYLNYNRSLKEIVDLIFRSSL